MVLTRESKNMSENIQKRMYDITAGSRMNALSK
jgi:hypothetical protein